MPAYRPQAGDEGADMAISAKELPLGKVFTPDFRFTIPSFQRAYIWKTENILQLVSDLDDACKSPGTPYFLGSLILVREGDNRYDVIDGQQRLVSLSIIIAVLRDLERDPDLMRQLDALLVEPGDKLRGIVITHGHEDHTGTLPYLLKDLDRTVNIYATKLTLGLIEGKFAEHRVKNAKLIEIKPGDEVKLGCFTVEPIHVNHSIPDAVGLFIQSPAGNVLHTGDFKLDQTPIDGITTDFGALARFSETGVDLMMSDSTNATNPNFTPSEAEVGKSRSSPRPRAVSSSPASRATSTACSRSATRR